MGEFDINNHDKLVAMQNAVDKAAELIGGPGADPLDVFPDPASEERRADISWGENVTLEQEQALRGIVAEFGPGRAENFGPEEAGLENGSYSAVLEGGQPHKMIAELNLVTETESRPAVILLTADTGRNLGDKEREIGSELLRTEVTAETEKEMAEQIVVNHADFVPSDEETEEADWGEYTSRTLGTLGGTPVVVIGIKRIYTSASEFTRLNNFDKMMMAARGGDNVAFVTSATYEPSNQVSAAQAREATTTGIHPEAEFTVLSYGTYELAKVKGGQPVEPTLSQLGAEVCKAAKLLRKM